MAEEPTTSRKFVEDKTLVLPAFVGAPLSFGALWDCHASETVHNINLFRKVPGESHLKLVEIQQADYTLQHVKSSSDRQNLVCVNGEVSLELINGLIKVGGSADYNDDTCMSLSEEELLCSYDLRTCLVETQESVKELVDDNVLGDLLREKPLSATHVVLGIEFGGKFTASIKIKEANSKSKTDIKGNFFGNLLLGKVTAAAKFYLQKLDREAKDTLEKHIHVTSQPTMPKQPTTIEEMFDMVTKIHDQILEHEAFKIEQRSVYGVPIRLQLVPIHRFVHVKVERIYLTFEDTLLHTMTRYVTFLKDFKVFQYLHKKILDIEPALRKFLYNPENPLSKQVKEAEECYKRKANEAFETLGKYLKEYKAIKGNTIDMLKAIRDLQEEININIVLEEARKFVQEGRVQLLKIADSDIEDSHKVKIFVNETDMEDWYQKSKDIKILIRTGNTRISSYSLATVYGISAKLSSIGVLVGVAVPNISNNQTSLAVKINGEEEIYNTSESIEHVVQVLKLLVNEAGAIETRFFTIYASLALIKLPFAENLNDLHRLIRILDKVRLVHIAESYLQTIDLCFQDSDSTILMMNLDCLDSALDSVKKYLLVQHENSVEWVVGKWAFEENQFQADSPVIFVFEKKKLVGVCCDIIDTLILKKALNGPLAEKQQYLNLLRPTKRNIEGNTFHRNRAQYALNVALKLQPGYGGYESALVDPQGFETTIDQSYISRLRIQGVIRAFVSSNWNSVYTKLKEWVLQESEFTDEVLQRIVNVSTDDTEELIVALQNLLECHSPFISLVSVKLKSIKVMGSQTEDIASLSNVIQTIKSHIECPPYLKQQLQYLQDITTFTDMVSAAVKQLENYLTVAFSQPKLEIIDKFLQLLRAPNDSERESLASKYLLPRFLSRTEILDKEYPGAAGKLQQYTSVSNFYGSLDILTAIQVNPCLYYIQNAFEKLISIEDAANMTDIMVALAKQKLTTNQYKTIFGNKKVQLLLKEASNSSKFLENVENWFCSNELPKFFPSFLQEKLKPFVEPDELKESCLFDTLENTLDRFYMISKQGSLPDDFLKTLIGSLNSNDDLKHIFCEAGALLHWDDNIKLFLHAWTIETVKIAYDKLIKWKEKQSLPRGSRKERIVLPRFEVAAHPSEQAKPSMKSIALAEGSVASRLIGKTLETIMPKDFLAVTQLLPLPASINLEEEGYTKLLDYIFQRIKMWGLHVLSSENLSDCFKTTSTNCDTTEKKSFGKFDFSIPEPESSSTSALTSSQESLARIDFFSILLAKCHPLVAQDILKIVSQFSTTLPLIVRNIKEESDSSKFTCLIPLLKTCKTKWKYAPGEVHYNELFTDPFKMIVCVRVGSPTDGKTGKSTIVNQVLSRPYMFSALSNPGSKHGKPLTLDGSVEFCTLTKETSSTMLWKEAVEPYYESKTKELLLLANLHGDVLQWPETLKVLKTFASKFIVFFNTMSREDLIKNSEQIGKRLGPDWHDHWYPVLVDPTDACKHTLKNKFILTSHLVSDGTNKILREVLLDAIKQQGYQSTFCSQEQNMSESVAYAPNIETKESQEFINFIVKTGGCETIKSALKLQKMNPKLDSYQESVSRIWNDNRILQELFERFLLILRLPRDQRVLAISHLERELSRLTAEKSDKIRNRIKILKDESAHSTSLVTCPESKKKQDAIASELCDALEELDRICLGLEHIYREVGRIFAYNQSFRDSALLSLPATVGELLVDGKSVEVLDGDLLYLCNAWFTSVCDSICKKYGDNLKIFVLSIIGLQSSGKSTLLNASYGCKFAVSVGRCTRGLFMQFLFLEEKLASELGVDALIILDTEGLGSPEKLTDNERQQKDRQLAAFTVSVSNLTIINVVGEALTEISEILQVVLVAMGRLEKVNMSPDICMVQHISELDSSKLWEGEIDFAKALRDSFELSENNGVNMGIRSFESLKVLHRRIKGGDLARRFPNFKNGGSVNAPPSEEYHEAVVDLYKLILDTIKETPSKQTFRSWYETIHSYWEEISKQELVMSFKNIKEIHEFIERGTSIANVKSAIDDAFRTHRETFEQGLRQCLNKFVDEKNSNREWEEAKRRFLHKTKYYLASVPWKCSGLNMTESNHQPCIKCNEAVEQMKCLLENSKGKPCQEATDRTIENHLNTSRDCIWQHLNQKADALMVLHGKSVEFDEIITRKVNELLAIKPSYTEDEMDVIIKQVWFTIQQNVNSKMKVERAHSRILAEISGLPLTGNIMNPIVEANKLPELRKIPAIDAYRVFSNKYLEFNHVNQLERELSGIAEDLMAEYKSKQYETGMVAKVNSRTAKILNYFEDKVVKMKLQQYFKWSAAIFALVKFTRKMDEIEKEWNLQNNPMHMLEKRKEEYTKNIRIWLSLGIGYESEGNVIGVLLLRAIYKRARKQGDEEHVRYVGQQPWLRNSENVRLEYFVDMCKEIQEGNKGRAIDHFSNPKSSITKWFNTKVNSIPRDKGELELRKTLDSEFNRVKQKVQNEKTAEGLRDFVKDYLTLVQDEEYIPRAKLNFAEATDGDFGRFQLATLKKLKEGWGTWPGKIEISDPSQHEKVEKILGCCEHCFWCGALCWGEFGHDINVGRTKRHHACHQAQGLIGTRDKETRSLIPDSCDTIGDDWTMYWPTCPGGMSWPQTKQQPDFVSWEFTVHRQNYFNDLMKWFFMNLHNDIATARGALPAPSDRLSTLGFSNLPSINYLLSEIENRLK